MADQENVTEQISAAVPQGETAGSMIPIQEAPAPVEVTIEDRIARLEESHKLLQVDVGNNYTAQLAIADRAAKVDTDLEVYKSEVKDQIDALGKSYEETIANLKTEIEQLKGSIPQQITDATKDLTNHGDQLADLKKRLEDAGILR